MAGRPINLVIRHSTNFTMRGMRFVQSQFWSLAVHTARDLLFEDIFIHSVSNSSVRRRVPTLLLIPLSAYMMFVNRRPYRTRTASIPFTRTTSPCAAGT